MTKVKIDIPYGHSYINCNVANDNLKAILSMKENLTNKSRTEEDIVIESFENPIESKKLADISKGKKNAIVIDVGINRIDGKIIGDVDTENVLNVAKYLTPVPGGVGITTVISLLENLIDMASK